MAELQLYLGSHICVPGGSTRYDSKKIIESHPVDGNEDILRELACCLKRCEEGGEGGG